VGINGTLNTAQAIQNFPATWRWSNEKRGGGTSTFVVPTAGTHRIDVWMREDGLQIDQMAMTLSSSWVPSESAIVATTISTESTSPPSTQVTDSEDSTEDATSAHVDAPVDESVENETEVDTQDVVAEQISIQAEDFQKINTVSAKSWVAGDRTGFNGTGTLVSNSNNGALFYTQSGSPELQHKVNFAQAGTYTVWIRGWGDTVNGEGKNDSLHVGINGSLSTAQAIQDFPAAWSWSNTKRAGGTATLVVPSAGIHTVNVWMREDGFEFDQLVLSLDAGWSPN